MALCARNVVVIDRRQEFPPRPASIRAARLLVADALEQAQYGGDTNTVLLLVSELATNAVRHAATHWELRINCTTRTVRVEVVDHDPSHRPQIQHPGPEATSGRGMLIVDELATRWGCEARRDAKSVWFSCA